MAVLCECGRTERSFVSRVGGKREHKHPKDVVGITCSHCVARAGSGNTNKEEKGD